MNEAEPKEEGAVREPKDDLRGIIRGAIEEFIRAEQTRTEPAYKTELIEERKRREQLEKRVNELATENERSRAAADRAERDSVLRAELQRLGVSKVDLAFRAVKDDVQRTADGRIVARSGDGEVALRDYLSQFVNENPELLPARMAGGSGMETMPRLTATSGGAIDLERIRPGMNPEELERARQEVARLASQTLKGL
ncbi:MAG: hypothetical protein ABSF98_04260 [Bryobacteraceae bacterium]|jgi:hypothetical protein